MNNSKLWYRIVIQNGCFRHPATAEAFGWNQWILELVVIFTVIPSSSKTDFKTLFIFFYPPLLDYDVSMHCFVGLVVVNSTSLRSSEMESGCSSYRCFVLVSLPGWIIRPELGRIIWAPRNYTKDFCARAPVRGQIFRPKSRIFRPKNLGMAIFRGGDYKRPRSSTLGW
jgi:hypothetical protein